MKSLSCLLVAALWLFSPASFAEQKQQLGAWDVHYIVVNNSLLDPAVAQQYGLQRSAFEAFLNISVLNHDSQQAQQVELSGSSKDLLGVVQPLQFRQVVEGDAVYYLATIPVRTERQLSFNIQIKQENSVQQLNFTQAVYPELDN